MSYKLVSNWPADCPECGCREFSVNSQTKIVLPSGAMTHHVQNRLSFTCRDDGCKNSWVQDLASFDPVVYITDSKELAASIPRSPEEVTELLAVDGSVKLSDLFRVGAADASRKLHDSARTEKPDPHNTGSGV